MATSNVYDNHTLFIKCDCASVKQIRQAFHEALTTYQTKTQSDLNCRFRVNLVENREGKSFGIAFVFVTNPAVYHMLLGKNPDGSDRIEYRDDPSWSAPAAGDIANDAGWSTISAPVHTPATKPTRSLESQSDIWSEVSDAVYTPGSSSGKSWCDMMDEEEEAERQALLDAMTEEERQAELRRREELRLQEAKSKYVCPKIPFPLEPLMVLPPYQLTPQQIAEKREKIIADNEGKAQFNPDLVEIPSVSYFSVDRAMATPVESKFMSNILKCKEIPLWVTKEDLKAQFSPYASDSATRQERFIKGRRVEETYPFVNINDDRVAFIIFDPSTHDAQFALHMMKKTVIRKEMPDNKVNEVTLIFGHSYRTDRDMMADISQKPRPVPRRDNTHPARPTRDSSNTNCNNSGPRPNYSRENTVRRAAASAVPQRRQPADTQVKNKFSLLDIADE